MACRIASLRPYPTLYQNHTVCTHTWVRQRRSWRGGQGGEGPKYAQPTCRSCWPAALCSSVALFRPAVVACLQNEGDTPRCKLLHACKRYTHEFLVSRHAAAATATAAAPSWRRCTHSVHPARHAHDALATRKGTGPQSSTDRQRPDQARPGPSKGQSEAWDQARRGT